MKVYHSDTTIIIPGVALGGQGGATVPPVGEFLAPPLSQTQILQHHYATTVEPVIRPFYITVTQGSISDAKFGGKRTPSR